MLAQELDLVFHDLLESVAGLGRRTRGAVDDAEARSLQERGEQLSPSSRRMLGRLVEHDILGLYHRWETVPASAEAIGRRFRRANPFTDVDAPLSAFRDRLESDFLEFYPELVAFSDTQKETLR